MRIQHNIMAMGAYRNYTNNVSAMKKNLEKLSSGYKINRAGDDAAGLAISEKMRAQITGLETAQKNAKDGISLVQTAEGALTEVHDMLNRMVELATQSANGTYDNTTDRYQLQKEMNQLRSEINRIADSSNFNGIKLLDGSMSSDGTVEAYSDVQLTAIRDAKEVKEPAKGKYQLDISQAKWTAKEDGAQLSFSIGNGIGIDLTEVMNKDQTITGAQVAQKWLEAQGTTATVTIDGKDFTVTHDGNGILTFTGTDTTMFASNKSPVSGSAVKVDVSGSSGLVENYANEMAGNQGWGQALQMIEEPASSTGSPYAQASFTFGTGAGNVDVKDGTTIRIGDTTYTFAVGKNSMFKGSDKAIDLTDIEIGASNLYGAAAARLTQAALTNTSVLVDHDTNTGKVYLTERAGGINRDEYDLFGKKTGSAAGDMKDATWKSNSRSFVQVGQSAVTGTALTLQIGDTADDYNQLKVNISDCHTKAMGIASVDISTQANAAAAVDKIKAAINYVSDVRGTLGATQNRLDHTINNLSVMTENIQDAESTIRDTDVAAEMMEYTKNNILIQSAQAMLAQANQVPQGVLQLLQ